MPRVNQLFWFGFLAFALIASGCSSINRCKDTNGTVIDVTALTTSPSGDILVGGTLYILKNCVLEEIAGRGARHQSGLILTISGDLGKSWVVSRIPLPHIVDGGSKYQLSVLETRNDKTIFAGINCWTDSIFKNSDNNARLYRSDDKGHTWTLAYDFGHDTVFSIVTAPDSVVIAALCKQGLMRSKDDGKTWMQSGLHANEHCSDLALTSNKAEDVYINAWGKNGPGFYHSTDAGETWTRMPLPATRDQSKIVANAKGDVVAAISGPWKGEVYRSNDKGKTWKRVNSPHEYWIEQLGVSADGTILLKTMDNLLAPGGGSFISNDGGETWTRENNVWTGANNIPGKDSLVVHPSGILLAFERIDFNDPPSTWGKGWGKGWGGYIYSSDDSGQSWHVLRPLIENSPE